MYYTLLCLRSECCGMDIMERVSGVTNGRVNIGPGTTYNLLEQFLSEGIIQETKVAGRRRSYILTSKGRETLEGEYQRLCALVKDYRRFSGEGDEK
jgi:DNA-binding PadR family transcriptional regulator